jgi:ring-1,2-phenylacetyl-CoA epoxidase subunit PaaD
MVSGNAQAAPSPRSSRGEGPGELAKTRLANSPRPSSGAAQHLLPASREKEKRVLAAIAAVTDPEIPVLTLDDLGVIRRVVIAADGEVEVDITPTYSGCPAMSAMALDLQAALAGAGFPGARIRTVLSPAWTTDWISAEGRAKLAAYGIAPPTATASRRALFAEDEPLACPRCASLATVKISEFGSTACKALWRCEACLEPFDAFKCI